MAMRVIIEVFVEDIQAETHKQWLEDHGPDEWTEPQAAGMLVQKALDLEGLTDSTVISVMRE